MRKTRLFFFLLCCFAFSAQASIVSGTINGTIQLPLTTDTYGLFGATGADLLGDSISVSYSYTTADFTNPSRDCGPNCTYYNATQYSASDSISVTINGNTETYIANAAGLAANDVIFDDGNHYFEEVIFTNLSATYDAAQLMLESSVPSSFGNPSGPLYENGQDLHLYVGGQVEELRFSTVTATPEPSSLILVASGLLAFGAGARRRALRG